MSGTFASPCFVFARAISANGNVVKKLLEILRNMKERTRESEVEARASFLSAVAKTLSKALLN